MYIAVSGNIGSGKTSLVEMLAHHFKYKPYFENIDNPYLDDFYQDMGRWSFNLQMCFLANKVEQIVDIKGQQCDVIQDRTIFEEAYVFVANLHQMGLISARDFDIYMQFFGLVLDSASEPDLVVYLKASVPTLISQIQRRGRAFEMGIEPSYLEQLNKLYDHWITNVYKGRVVVIDIDNCDFVLYGDQFNTICEQIESEIKNIR